MHLGGHGRRPSLTDGSAIGILHNVVEEEDWVHVVQQTIDAHGTVNVLVNSAGVSNKEDTMAEWKRVLEINLTGSYLGIRSVIPIMKKAGGGSIVNIASLAGMVGGGFNGYAASKGGIRAISRAAAVDYAKDSIRVNSIYPGLIITPMTEGILHHQQLKEQFEEKTPLPRFGTPDDIAFGVLYLASDVTSYVTGTELVIDGGTTAS
ncbi:SDR family oxidoreductase [Cohnella herbarum]|uniref:SDR family oxidoreductase n=1 Tax=Cohnella herbarum TaxID=2728023 RepID=A0A7Z2ZMM8_9BACL|nr:SDR family oxidoreductase [Cohnella herbarum]